MNYKDGFVSCWKIFWLYFTFGVFEESKYIDIYRARNNRFLDIILKMIQKTRSTSGVNSIDYLSMIGPVRLDIAIRTGITVEYHIISVDFKPKPFLEVNI